MPFLIDGHNVIAALPDIELEDPHDEAKLVFKLRAWTGRERRKAIVVFDGGVPGGYSRALSTHDLRVIFAAQRHTNADRIIKARLRRLPDAPNWTVVSSDHEVLDQARAAGAKVMTAQVFSEWLIDALAEVEREKPGMLSAAEVEEWLTIFQDATPETSTPAPIPPTPDVPTPEPTAPSRKPPPRPDRISKPDTHTTRTIGEQLGLPQEKHTMPLSDSEQTSKPTYPSDKEVKSWLKLFPEPPEGAFEPSPPKPRVDKAKRKRRQLAVDKDGSEQLSDQDVDAWLEVFERPEPPASPAQSSTSGQHKPPQTGKLLKHKQQSQREGHNDASELSPEEREQWQRLFGEKPGM